MKPRLTIELAGVPCAGKTTTAYALRGWLVQHGFHAEVVREGAELAPFEPRAKLDWRFNAWTLCYAMSEVLRLQCEEEPKCSIFDRGLFDAICWIRWHVSQGRISVDEGSLLEKTARIPAWYESIDLIYVLTASFETAMERRNGRAGRVVNKQTFCELEDAYSRVVDEEVAVGPAVMLIDTDRSTPQQVLEQIVEDIEQRGGGWRG